MKIEKFEDIDAWKEGRKLVTEVYKVFAASKDYGFRDQIQRAAISVMSNIAEGFDRGSNKEFVQFLVMARGSASEVRSLLYAAKDIRYIDGSVFNTLTKQCTIISSLLTAFIRYLKHSERKS
jgi:four helix bundle protein